MREEGPRCATLQNVLDALNELFAAGDIDANLCRESRSAILSFSRAAGKSPHKLKADIVELLDRLNATSALREGFLPSRWSNLKSLLRRALNLAGNATKRARRDAPLSPLWQRLLNGCEHRDVQYRLHPFAGYCTDHSIAPGQVDEAVLDAYAREVRAIARSRNPTDKIKKVRRCWNKLVNAFPDELTFRARTWTTPRQWAQRLESMPQSFQSEMALLKKARSPETFEEIFRCRPLKNGKAVREQCATIMRVVAVMHKNGHPLSNFTSLRYIVQPEHFEATIRGLKRQTGAKDLRQLGSYVSVIHWLAETWVQLGVAKMRKLTNAMKIVGRRKAEIADSSLQVLDQLDNPVKREKVKMLGDTIFVAFRAKGAAVTRKDAVEFRDSLYWELGLMTGWRPSSRARINIEEDIRWTGRKGRETATLTAPRGSEKTELRRKVELPVTTSQMLRHFIDQGRELLRVAGDDDNPFLYTGRFGGHINSGHLSKQSAKLIARRTHVVGATGHKSRHASVKLHLAENPGDWQTVQEHAGHRDAETTRRFYALVTQVESTKRVQKSMGRR